MNKKDIDAALDDALMQTFPASDPFHIAIEAGSIHPGKNSLPESRREETIALLQARLADTVDLATQTKQACWNVKGRDSIALHELFDHIHDQVEEYSDAIAKRLVALGGQAYGTAREAGRRSSLPDYPVGIVTGEQHVDAMSTALAEFGKSVRAAIGAAYEYGDQDTSDLFTDVSRGIYESLRLIESHS